MKKQINLLILWVSTMSMVCYADFVDPTRPPAAYLPVVGAKGETKPLRVTAIFIYPDYKLAIINGNPLTIGGLIDEFTITAITSYTVELEGPNAIKETLYLAVPIKSDSHAKE